MSVRFLFPAERTCRLTTTPSGAAELSYRQVCRGGADLP